MSRRFTLDKHDAKKIGIGAAIAGGGALLAMVAAKWFPEALNDVKTGAALAAAFAVVLAAGRKLVNGGKR